MRIVCCVFTVVARIGMLIAVFSPYLLFAQPVGQTSYERPTFRKDIAHLPFGAGGLAAQHLHWKDWSDHYKKNMCLQEVTSFESKGLLPLIGMQGWQDTYVNAKNSTHADFNNPAIRAFAKWREDRPELWSRKIDGELPGFVRSGEVTLWGYISPGMPLDEKDIPENSNIQTYGDWMAKQYGELCGFLGGVRAVALSDFYDSHPHLTVDVHDFNPRLVDVFIKETGLKIPAGSLQERGKFILDHHRTEWIDFCCRTYARFWGRMAESIQKHHPQNLPALILLQCEHPIAQRRLFAVDHRIVAQVMNPDHILCGWDTQRMCGHRRNYAPESCTPSLLGVAAAREPSIRHFPNMECDVKDFWEGVDVNWANLTEENRKELGWKRLKRLWLETAWSHIADHEGKVRRTVCAFERYYWDGGKVPAEVLELALSIHPKKSFGPAFYYSLEVEKEMERNRRAYMSDWNRPIYSLREQGLACNYYVSEPALNRISAPDFWVIPVQDAGTVNPLSKAEYDRLAKIAPVVIGEDAVKEERNSLRFSGGNHGITGFGFYDQTDRLIVVVSDAIVKGESNNALPATTATIFLRLPNGTYSAKELFSGEVLEFNLSDGKGEFKTDLARWDTKVFAITKK